MYLLGLAEPGVNERGLKGRFGFGGGVKVRPASELDRDRGLTGAGPAELPRGEDPFILGLKEGDGVNKLPVGRGLRDL